MIRKVMATVGAVLVAGAAGPLPAAVAQEITGTSDLAPAPILSTLLYGLIGILLYVLSYFVFDRLFRLDLRRELVEDQNQALGIMLAGLFIGIALVIAAAIGG